MKLRTPAVNPRIMATMPIFFSVAIAAVLVWYFNLPKLAPPLILGIIAGGLVDLDNRLTGRLKNILFTVIAFSISSLTAQLTMAHHYRYTLAMTVLTFGFTLLGAVGLRYRTIAFGTLAVAIYTTLTYSPDSLWYVNPLMILFGTVLYSSLTLLMHMLFPHRPVQENVAAAYAALGGYFDAKAAFFDPDESDQLDKHQIGLAMKNTGVIGAFNQCRSSLFYRMRGQHRHPRTSRMLRYYFTAQDIHERISSAHVDYRELAEKLKNTDLIFRIQRLLELQARACRDVAESLRSGTHYEYSERLARAITGCKQSLKLYADTHEGADVHTLRRLLDNLYSIDYQLSHLESEEGADADADSDATRIAALEKGGLKNALVTLRGQLNFESAVFRHAVRLSLVVLLICAIIEAFDFNLGYWILLTALFVCQPNYSATKSRVNQRIVGTLLGVLVGSIVPYFTPSMETKLWIIVVSTTLFFFFRTNKYSFSTFFITIQALTSFSLAGFDVYAVLPFRLIDTVIGAVIAWVAVSHLWPDWRYLTLERTAGRAIAYNGAYLRVILDQLQNGGIDDVSYRSVRRQTHERAAALSSTLSDMSSEPKKYGSKVQDGFELLRLNYTLVGYISALGAYRNQMQNQSGDGFIRDFYRTAYRIADLLDHIRELDEDSFQTAYHELETELQALQPDSAAGDRQQIVLWQQLVMITRQLPPCFAALYRERQAEADNAVVEV
ncbi:membrane protein [Neisseria arctica]|uniref:Membrane protein n=1 Tax=Neisseria arctica TaxID=1470200 RepID=A0A0J0YPZ4_9NEIS|nr:YccS family putative transporter [Neisseria arctica]KLT72207.1 membrane protein [Neisseria arctica]UOO86680.1 YccS family putative transporter [Neisseria arctica]